MPRMMCTIPEFKWQLHEQWHYTLSPTPDVHRFENLPTWRVYLTRGTEGSKRWLHVAFSQDQHQAKNLVQTHCFLKSAILWHAKIANGTYTRTPQSIIQHHTCYSHIPRIKQSRTFYSALLNEKKFMSAIVSSCSQSRNYVIAWHTSK
jgi:hypothetical protein